MPIYRNQVLIHNQIMSFFISHIAYAELLLPNIFSDKKREDFIIGASFPDIRYLGVIERDKTHLKNITLNDVLEENNPFLAGVKFHGLTDIVREDFMNKNAYGLITGVNDKVRPLKLAEDIILSDKIGIREEYVQILKNILPEEKSFLIPDYMLERWHKIVSDYLEFGVSRESIINASQALFISDEDIRENVKDGYLISSNDKIKDLVLYFYNNLEKELLNYHII